VASVDDFVPTEQFTFFNYALSHLAAQQNPDKQEKMPERIGLLRYFGRKFNLFCCKVNETSDENSAARCQELSQVNGVMDG
jgi:hypothetical protein